MCSVWRYVCLRLFALCAAAIPAFALQAAPPALSLYGALPGVEQIAVSPSGDRIAIIGVLDEQRRLVIVDQSKKSGTTFALQKVKVRGVFWAGDDHVLLYTSDTATLGPDFTADKAELFSMIVVPLNGGEPWPVFGKSEKIGGGVRGFYGIQAREGRFYGYFSGITYDGNIQSSGPYLKSTKPVLYEVDLQTGEAKAIAPRFEEGLRSWVMAPGGKVGATLDYTSRSGDWILRNGSGKTIGEGINPLGGVDLVGLGATPDTVILSEARKDADPRWLEIPLAGGASQEILAGVPLEGVYLDDRTRRLTGYRLDGDVPAYHFFDPYRQKVIAATLKAFPDRLVHLVSANDRFDRLVVMTEGVGDPQTWWMVDIKTGAATVLGTSYPMDADDVGPMRIFKYKAGDGTPIEGVLTLPPGRQAKNLPVVVLPHGGPAMRDHPGFDWWAQALASRGYAVLQPNFRGSSGYGAGFRRAGKGEWGRAMQSDISDGLAALAAQGIVDPRRACIVGASYGGYAALAGVTLQQGLYRCAVAVAGVSDVARFAITEIRQSDYDGTMRRALEDELGAHKDLGPVSPINFAARADAPILLIHGKNDTVVAYAQSTAMAAALRKAGKPVELVTLPGEDHWLSHSETRRAMLEATVHFVETHNPPDPAP